MTSLNAYVDRGVAKTLALAVPPKARYTIAGGALVKLAKLSPALDVAAGDTSQDELRLLSALSAPASPNRAARRRMRRR